MGLLLVPIRRMRGVNGPLTQCKNGTKTLLNLPLSSLSALPVNQGSNGAALIIGDAMSKTNLHANRPLSPHLQIYKLIPTMVMSIVHRITGGALYFGTLLVAWWLIATATSEAQFNFVSWVLGSWIGLLVLLGYTWALLHHMIGGIRHLIWDTGRGLDKHTTTKMAWASLVLSIALTVLIWVAAFTIL
ncbi:succinate dehydrogenase subunit C [Phyllobacterium sp. OV277]|nr:succinate dehydrogenase subunit C [Phyllobacterium sp. OV277]